MAMGNLNGISKEITDETVQRVADLLNSGQVTVGEVSQYFTVPPEIIMQSLTGVSAKQFANNSYTAEDADKLEKLIRTGVASTGQVAEFAGTTPDIIERHLTDIRGYTPADVANAQAGQGNISAPAVNTAALAPTSLSMPAGATANINPAFVNADGTGIGPVPYSPTEGLASASTIGTGESLNLTGTSPSEASPQVAQTAPQFATQEYATGSEIPTGLKGSEMALKGGALGAIEMLDMLNQAGRSDLADQYAQGLQQAETQAGAASGFMQPYQQAGQTALQQQMALSGALGQDAFNQAYQESPQIAFLREQGMRANLAAAGATGGLGGGNVQKELQRFGQGLASQGLQQQIQNLSGLTSSGQNAAGTMANIATGLGNQQLNARMALGQNLAGQSSMYGLPAAQQIGNLGVNLAGGRTRAGELLANQYGSAATALGNIYSSQGSNLANMLGGQTASIIDQRNQAALNEARAQQGYGADMSNIQSGIGSAIAGVPNAPIAVPNYQNQAMNALYSAGAGYNMFDNQQQPANQFTPTNPTGTFTPAQTLGWSNFINPQPPQMPSTGASGTPVIVT